MVPNELEQAIDALTETAVSIAEALINLSEELDKIKTSPES